VPFLPYYTLNQYDPEQFGLGTPRSSWKTGVLQLAVRCVNHLPGIHIHFPSDMRFTVSKSQDTLTGVRDKIIAHLRTANVEEEEPSSALLFKAQH